ncbi:MAG: hypothetical protein JSS81_23830 [Acidobacteria bacterium]|nr:hypothetical protein [Acidobacteriota bacterium]
MRIIFCLLAMGLVTGVFGQGTYKQAVDQAIAQKGANLFIESDKQFLEPNETARIKLEILLYPETVPGDENPPLEPPAVFDLPSPNTLYQATNWRIVEGGGKLVGIDETTVSYTAPAKLPAGKKALVSVDLQPLKTNLPKIVLLQTIYFEENDTAFVLNLPALGFLNAKYVLKLNGGTPVPTVDPKTAKNLPPAARKQLEAAQKQMAAQTMNAQAMSSNGYEIYDENQGFTAVSLRDLTPSAKTGEAGAGGGISVLQFNFSGRDAGAYELGTDGDKTGLGFTLGPQGFGCGDMGPTDVKYPCNGKVRIESLDPRFMTGTVRATVFVSPPGSKYVYRGTFYGKFKVNRAN